MLAVFRYSFKRMLYSKSTLIMSIICLGFFSLFIYFEPYEILDPYEINGQIGVLTINITHNYFKTLSWFLLPIFCALKVNCIIAEERKNETLIMVIAKPISKIRFVLEKLLAYFVIVFMWTAAMTSVLVIMFYTTKPLKEEITFVLNSMPSMVWFSFILTFIFTSFYLLVSLYKNPSFNVGAAFLLTFGFSFFDAFSKTSVLNNLDYQDYGGKIVPRNFVNELKKGADEYRSTYRYINAEAHWLYLYFKSLAGEYSKYGIINPSVQYRGSRWYVLNSEPILEKTKILQRNELNNQVFKEEHIVVGYRSWFDEQLLYTAYWSIFAATLAFALYSFWKKDVF